jgi:hypothetical protein
MVNVAEVNKDVYMIDPMGSGRGTSVYLIAGEEIALTQIMRKGVLGVQNHS